MPLIPGSSCRRIVTKQGVHPNHHILSTLTLQMGFVGKNMIPWVCLNASVGVLLFETYTTSLKYLKTQHRNPHHPAAGKQRKRSPFEYKDAFLAGGIAGAVQSSLSIPLSNIQKTLTNRVDLADAGLLRRINGVLPEGNLAVKARFLYKEAKMHVVRDRKTSRFRNTAVSQDSPHPPKPN
jgi:hypothetical protein